MYSVPAKRKPRVAAPESTRLDASAWINAGLEILAQRGIDGVRIEVLAKRLNVTKGSFYWHFKDRQALLDGMLQDWRKRATLGIIERLEKAQEPPKERLVRLMRLQFESRRAIFGAEMELSIRLWGRHDDNAAEVLAEVDELRLRYIASLLEDCGIARDVASARAVLIYSYMRVSRSLINNERDPHLSDACESVLLGLEPR